MRGEDAVRFSSHRNCLASDLPSPLIAVRKLLAIVLWCLTWAQPALAAPRVAVQPFGGPETEPLRRQVANIVGRHGFHVLTSLAPVSGTSQYPGLAKNKHLSAFVVGEVVEKGKRISLSFLIWQGIESATHGVQLFVRDGLPVENNRCVGRKVTRYTHAPQPMVLVRLEEKAGALSLDGQLRMAPRGRKQA